MQTLLPEVTGGVLEEGESREKYAVTWRRQLIEELGSKEAAQWVIDRIALERIQARVYRIFYPIPVAWQSPELGD